MTDLSDKARRYAKVLGDKSHIVREQKALLLELANALENQAVPRVIKVPIQSFYGYGSNSNMLAVRVSDLKALGFTVEHEERQS